MNRACSILYHHRIRADDGQAVHVREMLSAMRQAGHDVTECALVPKAAQDAAAAKQASSSSKPGIWQRLSLPRSAVEVLEVLYNYKGRAMLHAAAKRNPPKFIYERHALHLRAGLDVARDLKVPLLLEVNSPMVAEMQRLNKLSMPRRARQAEHSVLSQADAILAVTEVLADMLVDIGAPRERVHVIGNGADVTRYGEDTRVAAASLRDRWQYPPDAFVLGFVGYMRPWHRLDLVLEIMKRPGLENVVLTLMGEGPALESLLKIASEYGIRERVRSLGVVPPDLLPAHVMACDGALVPAINAYASPLKLFDSMAAGVVTLAPDQPNLRENISDGENGLLFAEGDADAMYRQLLLVVGDRSLAHQIGAAGRQTLIDRQWTWSGNVERVMEVFHALPRGDRQ